MSAARWRGAALWLLVALAAPAASGAQDAAGLAVRGQVAHPRTVTLPALLALPPVSVKAAAGHDGRKASYTGALLWALVSAAAPVQRADGRIDLTHTIVARGRDGYTAAVALGEVDPNFEGKKVLVAYRRDGKPLDALRLIVPGDAQPGRNVKDLVSIDVR